MIEIYTDGTVTKNPGGRGRGGYLVVSKNVTKSNVVLTPIIDNTTNNRMELFAIAYALADQPHGSEITIYTDSEYCINVCQGRNTPKANTALVIEIRQLIETHKKVRFVWVRGHDGNKWNEIVDRAIVIKKGDK